ncbi:MAG: hypothetical protein ACKVZH_03845 [Blastocatellia bacterium]
MWNKKTKIEDEKLDRLSDQLFRALEASDVEINTAAESPFLFRRIHARIEAEQRRMAEESTPWFALMAQVRQAIPVFALLAIVALGSSLYLHSFDAKPTTENKAEQQTLIAGLPMFLQDDEEAVEASLVGFQNDQSSQR